ncbi:MAG TPA: DEAD/DEAH box helicase [Patescibacteria group bacterium]|nr:DEAD/DEAH box helicase [Patescibacteria group bacterium]
MFDAFAGLGVITPLIAGLGKRNITIPTEIQSEVIPGILSGKSLIAQSPTGTGKTLAYLIPLFQRIDRERRENQVIVLAPTHELVIQIQRQIEQLATDSEVGVTSASIIGNVNILRQIEKLKEKPQIIVGSAGRILELIQKKKIKAQTVRSIVIDEADRLLDDSNRDLVKAVIKTTLKDRQLLLFSATITPATQEQAQALMPESEVIVAGEQRVAAEIDHCYLVAEQREKIELLRKLVHGIHGAQALVFLNKSDQIEMAVSKLTHHGLNAAGLFGSSSKNDRQKALTDFRNRKVQLLVASDLAARGLDIFGVEYIISMDIPEEPEMYLHRAGRTGRAGAKGTSVVLLNPQELQHVATYERKLGIRFAARKMLRGEMVALHSEKQERK